MAKHASALDWGIEPNESTGYQGCRLYNTDPCLKYKETGYVCACGKAKYEHRDRLTLKGPTRPPVIGPSAKQPRITSFFDKPAPVAAGDGAAAAAKEDALELSDQPDDNDDADPSAAPGKQILNPADLSTDTDSPDSGQRAPVAPRLRQVSRRPPRVLHRLLRRRLRPPGQRRQRWLHRDPGGGVLVQAGSPGTGSRGSAITRRRSVAWSRRSVRSARRRARCRRSGWTLGGRGGRGG